MMTHDEAIAFLEEHGVCCDPSSCPEDKPWLNEVGEYVCDELEGMAEYDEDGEEVYDEDALLSLVDDAKAYEEDARQRYEADMEALGEDENLIDKHYQMILDGAEDDIKDLRKQGYTDADIKELAKQYAEKEKEDDIINESVEPFCEDYEYFNADDFEKEEIYGYEVDPNSDEYRAHEEIVNKIFKPKHIEELDWSVVTSADGDGYVYKEIVHFLDRDDWDKLQSVEDSRAYKKLTPNIGDYELLVSYHLDQGIDEFLDPAISFYAKSLGELSYGDDEEEEEDAESLDESASLTEGAEKAHWRKLLDILDKFNIDYGIDDEVDWNPEIKELVSIDGTDALALCSDGIYYGEQLMPWEGRFDAMKLLKALYDEGKEYGQYPSLKKIFDKNV